MTDHRLNIMTQAPYPDDMAALPNGIYITRAYTDMKPSSRQVSVIIRNMTSRPIHLPRGKIVACVLASNAVPNAEPSPELLKKLESDAPTKPHLSVEERHKLLIAALKKDRTQAIEDVATQAGCQSDQTVIRVPGHLLLGVS